MGTTGPSLTLDHTMVYTMMSDPAFFRDVPVYAFMKQQFDAVRKQLLDVLVGGKRDNCIGCGSVKSSMQPVMQTFTSHTLQLHRESPEALEALTDFITRKRKYRPRTIRMLYKEQGKVLALEW